LGAGTGGGGRARGRGALRGEGHRAARRRGADNGAVQLVVAPLAADRRFRPARDPGIFTAVLRTVPAYAAWLDVMDPITDVFPMGGLHNTLRRLVVDGT